MTALKVAVLGLGIMGGGMARSLLAAGFETAVWNRSPEKADALAAIGARKAETPADAARGADIVIAMLADDDASRRAWLAEADGALAAMQDGAIAIEASTLTTGWVHALKERMDAREMDFLDAPVTGSRQQSAEGKLRFLVGGDPAALERAAPAFAAMGSEAVHLGPTGSGATLKLVNNFLCGVQVASLAEAIAMIERSGLDVRRSVEILAGGAAGSPLVGALSARMLDRSYEPHFLVPLMAKDLAYAHATFAEAGIDLPSAVAARARFDTAADAGHHDSDIAAIIEPLRRG
ncbi:NAD(P)-dependent oxidoreductase [Sphingomonas sp. AP4-R1]|uniref:NAD(P)-dependent oxidoreductase n=1 Tax=Sphingomonas sp. AP4-R1 TaxID=2735134 RepID=UPI0014939C32|nr:NAD(P)-dependent oxidoreductase [Sphingomonas sp. AP4-R1]QJU58548.1 NAD(P)-dependent oxidoreductase [Sphingomonas sp. AP4-R1]